MDFKQLGENLGLEEDEYRELVDLFLETGRADFDVLCQAIATGDKTVIVSRAHTIAGAAGNLGFQELHQLAKQIEIQASADNIGGLQDASGQMQRMFDELAAFIAA